MVLAEIIRKLMKDQGLTQNELAVSTGLHPSSIGNYLYGQRKPDPLACLLIAGLCTSTEDKAFLFGEAKLKEAQISLIAKAVGPPIAKEKEVDPKRKRA